MNRPDIVIGPSKSGKTSLLSSLALHRYKVTGRPARLVTADLGGCGVLSHLVEMGVIEVWDIVQYLEEHPDAPVLEVLLDAVCGYWPVNGVTTKPGPNQDPSKASCYMFEGVTSFCDVMMSYLADLYGKGQKMGEEHPIKLTSGRRTVGGNNRTHYNLAQLEIVRLIAKSSILPDPVVWTAIEERGFDSTTSQFVYGPKAAGSALLSSLLSKFGNALSVEVPKEGERVLHASTWFEGPSGAVHQAGHRIPHQIPFPQRFVGKDFSLGVFYEAVDTARAEARKRIEEELKKK